MNWKVLALRGSPACMMCKARPIVAVGVSCPLTTASKTSQILASMRAASARRTSLRRLTHPCGPGPHV
eukprot:CAMPEP_0179874772 /NCGR_PEP_ID=MMETSP0982-20121206/23087_1 /TAXON_ID=483367 /ORGANISM="non described non described, Strain CCMP 2436" /LENGTH=67 /DNA_ID=CAMNT_0021766631 /DNA_START=680 /DNA_END=883 /DNA_ORIENTATION=-